jgi:uncharacterized protein (TIGR03663 family)
LFSSSIFIVGSFAIKRPFVLGLLLCLCAARAGGLLGQLAQRGAVLRVSPIGKQLGGGDQAEGPFDKIGGRQLESGVAEITDDEQVEINDDACYGLRRLLALATELVFNVFEQPDNFGWAECAMAEGNGVEVVGAASVQWLAAQDGRHAQLTKGRPQRQLGPLQGAFGLFVAANADENGWWLFHGVNQERGVVAGDKAREVATQYADTRFFANTSGPGSSFLGRSAVFCRHISFHGCRRWQEQPWPFIVVSKEKQRGIRPVDSWGTMSINSTSISKTFVCMQSRWLLPGVLLLLTLAVFCWRYSGLEERPMHHDEANQAVRCGDLLEGRGYRYDPVEHHGPSLYYLNVPLLRLQGVRKLAESSERHFRLLPLLFGCLLIMQTLCWRRELGAVGTISVALLLAASPAMAYYSRYYIQEMLLVFFAGGALCCLWRWLQRPRLSWALGLGAFLGLCHASKETWVISAAAMACGALLYWGCQRPRRRRLLLARAWRQMPWAIALMLLLSALFYSAAGQHPRAFLDSILAYANYWRRAGGAEHSQPWSFYLERFLCYRAGPGPRWSEWPVLALAALSLLGLLGRRSKDAHGARPLLWYLLAYALLQLVVYSSLAYKTPWCVLASWHGFILLAGCGVATLCARLRRWPWQLPGMALCALLLWPLLKQNQRANGRYAADLRNPYAYVHSLPDTRRLARRIDAVAALAAPQAQMPVARNDTLQIAVFSSAEDAWPLPWYLRAYDAVGYCSEPQAATLASMPPFIVSSPQFDEILDAQLGEHYQREIYGWRPNCFMMLRIRRDAWERWLATQMNN